MTTLKVSNLQSVNGVTNISIDSNTGIPLFPSGIEPIVISRGSPSSTDSPLLLSNLNTIHYYQTAGNSLFLKTELLEDSIYEMTYTSSGGSPNADFILYPNGMTYSTEFNSFYRATTQTTGVFTLLNQPNRAEIYFDHQLGSLGTESMGRLTIFTGPYIKSYMYTGSDTGPSLAYGYGTWTNDSRKWEWFGHMIFNGDNKRAWIRRVA
jgi:hypothetical protein